MRSILTAISGSIKVEIGNQDLLTESLPAAIGVDPALAQEVRPRGPEELLLDPSVERFTPGAVHVHDLQATILNQLGIDHTKLTYRFQGRDFRLTDVHGNVVRDLIR